MLHRISLPIKLLLVLSIVTLFGNSFSISAIHFFFTISTIFKECLGFLLPFIAFSFVCTGVLGFKKNAPTVISILLVCVIISNSLVSLISYGTVRSLLGIITDNITLKNFTNSSTIHSLVSFSLPRFFKSEHAMLAAIITGSLLSYINIPPFEAAIFRFKASVEKILNRLLIPFLPLYAFGFLLEIQHKGVFTELFQTYGKTFLFMFSLQLCMILVIYLIASSFHFQKAVFYIRNNIPAYLTAFSTMSSTTAIPVTMQCSQKNFDNKPLTGIATPILANIHLLGDAVTVPTISIVTLFLFKGTIPTIATFITFIMYFCFAMLAVSAVPGGGIIVMIPILKSILGYSDDMISVITTLYILQDGFGTASNVMGDGALMIIVNKILQKLRIK